MARAEHPLVRLWQRLERGEAVVAGVLSGTSADGIDVALVRPGVAGPAELLAFATRPFPEALALELRALLEGDQGGRGPATRAIALLHRDLGEAFGAATVDVARREGLVPDLVGSHGQTVFHHDGEPGARGASLQLGDGDRVARRVGAVTVSDFRAADLAAGGEGAPLSALVEEELFPAPGSSAGGPGLPRPAAVLNLGGIGNVTLLRAGQSPVAFDTGPANTLLDGLARRCLGQACDLDGRAASRGRASEALVQEFLRHPFFDRRPPRSTGRDTFGAPWVAAFLGRGQALGLGAEDLLASGVSLVAASVAEALRRFLPEPPRLLVLCGGGARNPALCAELERRTGLETHNSGRHGVDADAREALVFAHLAVRCVLGRSSTPGDGAGLTGAAPGAILGKISLPPYPSGIPSPDGREGAAGPLSR